MLEDAIETQQKVRKMGPLATKSNPSSTESSKTTIPASSSSTSSSYLTLKSHLLLMNTPTSKSNKYKRSHSSISNPETKITEKEDDDSLNPQKAAKSAPVQGLFISIKLRIFLRKKHNVYCG